MSLVTEACLKWPSNFRLLNIAAEGLLQNLEIFLRATKKSELLLFFSFARWKPKILALMETRIIYGVTFIDAPSEPNQPVSQRDVSFRSTDNFVGWRLGTDAKGKCIALTQHIVF